MPDTTEDCTCRWDPFYGSAAAPVVINHREDDGEIGITTRGNKSEYDEGGNRSQKRRKVVIA
jgi:hypothetical protein